MSSRLNQNSKSKANSNDQQLGDQSQQSQQRRQRRQKQQIQQRGGEIDLSVYSAVHDAHKAAQKVMKSAESMRSTANGLLKKITKLSTDTKEAMGNNDYESYFQSMQSHAEQCSEMTNRLKDSVAKFKERTRDDDKKLEKQFLSINAPKNQILKTLI